MFKEILQIVPQMTSSDLNKMESSLSKRFSGIARKFGSGLKAALIGGGVTALAVGVIDKLLNPLKEVQETMDKLLGRSSDLKSFAQQFGSSSGNLFKLEQMAGAQGLSSEGLRTLLLKFQTAVVNTKADPSQPSAVRNFLNEPDMAEGFLKFVQGLNMLSADQKEYAEVMVFGERRILEASKFLGTKDFGALANNIGVGGGTNDYTKKINSSAALNDYNKTLQSRNDTAVFMAELAKTQGNHGTGIVDLMNKRAQVGYEKEIDGLGAIKPLLKMQIAADKISADLEKGFLTLSQHLPGIAKALDDIADSRLIKGLVKGKVGK